MQQSLDSFNTKKQIQVGEKSYSVFSLLELAKQNSNISTLPFSLKVLLENLIRNEDNQFVKKEDVEAFLSWNPKDKKTQEIAYRPARVLLQDFTGVPCVVDLAAMRHAMNEMGEDPKRINPLQSVDLVIDHSVQIDAFGTDGAFQINADKEFERNKERYAFLKWGQKALSNFRVVPPDTGIVHQVNLEYLAPVVYVKEEGTETFAYPDTLVGTDSHTTMINGLGVLGWGVGGIEAEAAMLGQPVSMLIPEVVGFKLVGEMKEGTTATDLVLTIVELLRKKGVVDKFIEFYGDGVSNLPLTDRATIANMAPEYGATMGFFPVDEETLAYLRLSGREETNIQLVEAFCKEQGLFRTNDTPDPIFTDEVELDLSTVEPSLSGPKRPQDRVSLSSSKKSFQKVLENMTNGQVDKFVPVQKDDENFDLHQGSVVIASITSCTNTSNPAVMIGAGLLAKKAVEKGLMVKPWVKTSLAPGSKVVVEYLKETGLLPSLEALKFHLVGFGCATCIGNSGPLPEPVASGIKEGELLAVSVLSGNRNFEGRIHPLVKANYLASPPLVVAYALAGTANIDLTTEPLGEDKQGSPVFLKDIWPSSAEVSEAMKMVSSQMFQRQYANVFEGDEKWRSFQVEESDCFDWDEKSTYVKNPPFFEQMSKEPAALQDIENARVLALLGDSVTTDHISPAGVIPADGPAGKYLISEGVKPKDFNSFGARRGNHEVMMRGTFANIRLRNLLAPGTEGGWTRYFPGGEQMSIYDAAMKYKEEQTPLVILSGKEYGTGSSRDWAAKGTRLLGVRAVIAQSFERIHRSNLIGMGVLPLQFKEGQSAESLGLTGEEVITIKGISDITPRQSLTVQAGDKTFEVACRINTPEELNYYRHGGILQYVLRQLIG